MKILLTIVIAFFAFTGAYAQCNLTVTNNSATSINFDAVEAAIYSCNSVNQSAGTFTVAAGASVVIPHTSGSYTGWIGININLPVSEGYSNYNATSCIAGTGSYTVGWSACSVTIN